MNRSFGFLLVLLFSIYSNRLCLAQAIKLPYHQRIDLARGLPSDVIYELNQNKKGTLWLASEKGLFSYNGFTYKSYQIEKSNFYTNDVINVKTDYLNRPVALDFSRYLFIVDNNGLQSKQNNNTVPKLNGYNFKLINYSNKSIVTDGYSIYTLVGNTFKLEHTLNQSATAAITNCYKFNQNTLKLVYNNGTVASYNLDTKSSTISSEHSKCNYSIAENDFYVSLTKKEISLKFKGSDYSFAMPGEINTNDIYRHTFITKTGNKVYGLYSSHMFIVDLSSSKPKINWYYISDASTLSTLTITPNGTIFISTLGDGLYKINEEWLNTKHITYNTNSKIISYNNVNGEEIAYQKRRIYFYKNERLDRSIPVREDVLIRDIVYLNGYYYAAGSRFLFKIPEAEFKNITEFSYSSLANYTVSNQSIKDIKVFNNKVYYSTSTYLICVNPYTYQFDTLIKKRCEKMFVQKDYLFVNTEDYLRIYNLNAEGNYNVNLRATAITQKDSSHVLILSKTNDLYLFNLKDKKLTPIKTKVDKRVDDILWYKNYLYVCNSSAILKLHYFEHNQTTSLAGTYDFDHYDMELINQNGKFIISSNRGVMAVPINQFFKNRSVPNYLTIESSNGKIKNNSVYLDKHSGHLNLTVVDQNLSCNRYYIIIDDDSSLFNSGNIQLSKLAEGTNNIKIIGFDRFNRLSKPLLVKVMNSVSWFKSDLLKYILIGTVAFLLFLVALATYRYRLKILQVQTRSQNKEMETRLVALRSQMNPHFIYNVLNTAQSHMFSNNIQQANNIINKLSSIIREVLESTKTRYIQLGEEIDLITAYCDLEQARYDNKFMYEIRVDPNLNKKLKIPYFFVQPLVENAIWHGLIKDIKNNNRQLIISFTQQNTEVKITIDDNGVGYDANKVREGSVALNNLKERIELKKTLRKINSSLEIINKKSLNTSEKGTLATLVIKMPDFL